MPHGQVTLGESTWDVEVAMTRSDRYVGLGKRTTIEPETGMLFLYPFANEREFTMRDCHVPLDIAFLDSNRMVVKMFTMDVEADRTGCRKYTAMAQYMLEVPAGMLTWAKVDVGDVATFSSDVPVSWLSDP